eukprot:6212475-Pleurochrysis_carterae.AAC.1
MSLGLARCGVLQSALGLLARLELHAQPLDQLRLLGELALKRRNLARVLLCLIACRERWAARAHASTDKAKSAHLRIKWKIDGRVRSAL